MKLGLGLYRHQLDVSHYRFARQCGATHLVAHLVDYFRGSRENKPGDQPTGGQGGWGRAGDPDRLWTLEELRDLRLAMAEEGLTLAAIENFDPAHWHDILLDGPLRTRQIENVRTLIRRVGEAGIPCLGYNFSLAGVAARTEGPYARGGAEAVGMEGTDDTPIPNGMVWNMVYDPAALPGHLPVISHDELWLRLERFLREVLPVAEAAGVRLALHPDDPPTPTLRGTPRLVYQPRLYDRLLALSSSPSNALEFCLGSLAEMTEGDVHTATEHYASLGRIAYLHFRNVRGKVPNYKETFIDDGEIDVFRILRTLKKARYEGVMIPDHTPQMSCSAPWHAGMAHALGYLGAALKAVMAEPA